MSRNNAERIEEQLIELIRKLTVWRVDDELRADSDLLSYLDSLEIEELLAMISERTGCDVNLSMVRREDLASITSLAEWIDRKQRRTH